ATTDLIYVSPKSGGAVSRQAGDPWPGPLVGFPPFLRRGGGGPNNSVGPGAAGRLAPARPVPAASCAGAAGAGPFRRPRGLHPCRCPASGKISGLLRPFDSIRKSVKRFSSRQTWAALARKSCSTTNRRRTNNSTQSTRALGEKFHKSCPLGVWLACAQLIYLIDIASFSPRPLF